MGFYGILGEGGLILFLLDIYNTFGGDKYLDAAAKAAKYIADRKEDAPQGGIPLVRNGYRDFSDNWQSGWLFSGI